MAFIIGLLTFVLVLVCAALILLVLIQLPKKEAGMGVAFGGGATDALFGAGSGTVLTKATKYSAIAFFVLALVVGILQNHFNSKRLSAFEKELQKQSQQPPTGLPASTPTAGTAPLVSQPTATPTTTPATTPATSTAPAAEAPAQK